MITLLALAFLFVQEPPKPEDLLKAIEAIKTPAMTGSDDASIKKWISEEAEVARKKGELIWKLYQVQPDHAKMPVLLESRWESMFGRYMPPPVNQLEEFEKEIEQFLSNKPLSANRQVAERLKLRGFILRQWRTMKDNKWNAGDARAASLVEAALKNCDGFYDKYPRDEAGQYLYYSVSRIAEKTPIDEVVMQRLVDRYPTSHSGIRAKGRLHSLKSLGKPFALKFTDPLTQKNVDLKDYQGKVVLIDFWSLGCVPCLGDIQHQLPELLKKWGDKGLVVVGVNIDLIEDAKRKVMFDAIQKLNMTWPNHCTEKGQFAGLAADYGIFALPTQFLLDRQGRLRFIDATEDREKKIEQLLTEPESKQGGK